MDFRSLYLCCIYMYIHIHERESCAGSNGSTAAHCFKLIRLGERTAKSHCASDSLMAHKSEFLSSCHRVHCVDAGKIVSFKETYFFFIFFFSLRRNEVLLKCQSAMGAASAFLCSRVARSLNVYEY